MRRMKKNTMEDRSGDSGRTLQSSGSSDGVKNMAGLFTGLAVRKTTSGSSSNSSEATPLLNGSQEGPCYAYSYGSREEEDEGIADSVSSTRSSDDMEAEKRICCGFMKGIKLTLLMAVMLFCVISLSFIKVHDGHWDPVTVVRGRPFHMNVTEHIRFGRELVHLNVKGPFLPERYFGITQDFVQFKLYRVTVNGTYEKISKTWRVLVQNPDSEDDLVVLQHDFALAPKEKSDSKVYQLAISTNSLSDLVTLQVDLSIRPELPAGQIMMAVGILAGLYVLIIFDLVHRTLAAMIGATTAISCLALVGERPSLEEVLSWVDVETLSLLFGMMVLVSILCETGFFDYVAVLAYRLAKGQTWALITALCLVTAVLSAFLDNVTTILLMSAVAIRLCEAMNIDPKHMLIAMVVFSNIGGAATPVGDPPNVIIISHKKIVQAGIGFSTFTAHMMPAVLLCLVGAYFALRLRYRNPTTLRYADPPEVVEVKHEIEVWKKAYNSLSGYSRDEDTVRAILRRKITILETLLRKKLYDCKVSEDDYRASLKELSNAFKVKNPSLLLKSGVVIGVVILLFFLESIPELELSIGWIAILGAICLLVLADFEDLESVMGRVEWSTLLFFAALFVVMEALSRLDLVWYIVKTTQDLISTVDDDQRLIVALVAVLWISALSSSLIDNIPFTTVMVQVVTDLAAKEEMNLPLQPLVFALALGACLGGNGTLIGASANVVTAGLSEQHGYRFTFFDFFKIGFPVMILTTLIATAYLLVCHAWIGWND